ncbi:hypothetical protein EDD16DRAFT_1484079, partial [Pisolithus croceorrhizus]
MRTLGAWIGNNIQINDKWENILEKQRQIIKLWKASRPTLKGKELLSKSLIQSRALYLATVNNMPHNIELEMSNLIKTFLWNDKQRGLIDKCYTYAPTNKGGLNMPNIKARLEAIRIVWLKKYLTSEKRPAWAYVADDILRNNITPKPKTEQKSCISWALQSWHESAKRETKIPKQIKEMLQTARKYNLGLDSRQLSIPTLKKLPIWHHLAAENNYLWNKKSSKCLRDNHGVRTV